jgi:hypothetical protein
LPERNWKEFGTIHQMDGATISHIYVLYDPRSGEARYVGKSSRPIQRLQNHWNEVPSNCHRSHWIQELRRLGLKPELEVVESIQSVDEETWKIRERWWIAQLKALGANLVNNTDGGDGVTGLPLETRKKMAATWKGRKHKPESLIKMSNVRRGRKYSEASKAKRAATLKTIHHGEDWNSKVAEGVRKLTREQAETILRRLNQGEFNCNLSKEYGVHRTTLSKIKTGVYFERYRKRKTTEA